MKVAAPPIDRAALQRRVLRVLTAGQVVGAAALGAAVTIGAFVVQDILGQETPWGGVAAASFTTGAAVMAQVLSRLMRRRGRRPGLQAGYVIAAVGGIVTAVGAELGLLAVFLPGLFLFGNGQAANLLARYAATDLAEPGEQGRAMSQVVFASTFGAVFGPLVIGPAERAGQSWFGLEQYTGPWLLGTLLFAAAAVNTGRLRPDPLVVAGGLDPDGERAGAGPAIREALATVAAIPQARLALLAMVVSQGAMVAVMTMTPVHMRLHDHETLSQYVVSAHIAGMFAFSPLVGRFGDRRGWMPTVVTGAVILASSTVLAALAGDAPTLLFPSLWGLGLGWSFGLIGGSNLLSTSVPDDQRVAVQGTADLLMSLCGGVAGFSSGFVRRALGYHMLANLATMGALTLVAVAIATRRAFPTVVVPESPVPQDPRG
jgi:MFS family permease